MAKGWHHCSKNGHLTLHGVPRGFPGGEDTDGDLTNDQESARMKTEEYGEGSVLGCWLHTQNPITPSLLQTQVQFYSGWHLA